ncbi:hypothetical protein U0033_26585 [Chitinophaga sancti]|nr:hypothetical protein U0033_26585 [Chitinophaga sancti]
MYSIYVLETSKAPTTAPLYSGVNDVNVNPTNIVAIRTTDSSMSISAGQYLKFQGNYYKILSSTYFSYFHYYQLTIDGSIPVNYYDAANWAIYSSLEDTITNYGKLDVEDIQLSTVFAVSDISDISNRKNPATKTITLKGTQTNNQILGHLFHNNRYADESINNKLFFNYAPLRTVDCLVYEDNYLILQGNLYVQDFTIDEKGNITYTVSIAGKFKGFVSSLGDSLISDLDFSDLKHHYTTDNIGGSQGDFKDWNTGTTILGQYERYNTTTNTFYSTYYGLGSGYVYPFIDYGEKYTNNELNVDYSNIKLQNFRPAIWVKEYFDRIFKFAGYTYEIKGSADFINRFNSLLIPNSQEKLTVSTKENRALYNKSTSQTGSYNKGYDQNNMMIYFPVRWDTQDNTYLTDYAPVQYGDGSPASPNREHNLLYAKRTFTSDGRVQVSGSITGNNPGTENVSVQLVKRDYSTSTIINNDKFTVVAEQKFTVNDNQTLDFTADFIVPETTYNATEQLQVRIACTVFGVANVSAYYSSPTITSAALSFSKDDSTLFTVDVTFGDEIVPTPPEGIKMFDFVKSVINMFNLYVSNTLDNPKHFIFQTYDDFYALADIENIKNTALDWTNKIDYSSKIKGTSNLSIPKNYTFTYSDDSNDYLNKNYKTKYAENYSTLTFTDGLGITDNKEVKVVFSASPQVSFSTGGRVYPMLVQGGTSISAKSPVSTNIRVLYYNGIFATNTYTVGIDTFDTTTTTWGKTDVYSSNWYANVSMYWFDPIARNPNTPYESDGVTPKKLTPLTSLNFGNPKEVYFLAGSEYVNVPNLYNTYYINQTSELTNINLTTFEVGVNLNAVDITNLDLRVPVFINMGQYGHAYFKILNLEYTESEVITTVTLQRISF